MIWKLLKQTEKNVFTFGKKNIDFLINNKIADKL